MCVQEYLGLRVRCIIQKHKFIKIVLSPSTTSIHFLRTLGIPFQLVDPSEVTEHGESRTGTLTWGTTTGAGG